MATKPPALQYGDTIGLVTLGSPIPPELVQTGITTLEQLGYRVRIGKSVYASTGIVAGSDALRASDLMEMFEDKEVKMIMPTRGGTGTAGVLSYLDYRVIRANPKIITGYSDITVILNALYQFSGLTTFLGPMLRNFSPTLPIYNLNQFNLAVQSTASPRIIQNPSEFPTLSLVPGTATGRLVGGNLASIISSLGTRYEINTAGKILLIEENLEPTRKIHRYLKQLQMAGKLRNCVGFVIGNCTNCEIDYGITFEDVIKDLLVPLGKPILSNLSFSHSYINITLPIGTLATLDATNGRLTLLEPTVSAPTTPTTPTPTNPPLVP